MDRQTAIAKWSECDMGCVKAYISVGKIGDEEKKGAEMAISIKKERLDMIKKRPYLRGLKRFFYYHQYDEERFPHFRPCDQQIDYEDSDEENNDYYLFFD